MTTTSLVLPEEEKLQKIYVVWMMVGGIMPTIIHVGAIGDPIQKVSHAGKERLTQMGWINAIPQVGTYTAFASLCELYSSAEPEKQASLQFGATNV